jgi:hypothetical protein
MDDMVNELFDVITERVDLVGVPANRRMWAIAKSGDASKEADMPEETKNVEIVPEPVETVQKAEFENVQKENSILKDKVLALEKANRMKDLEPLCKELDLEAEKVWRLEQVDKEVSDYLVGKLSDANKRVTALMKELGSAGQPKAQNELMIEAQKVAKANGVSMAEAIAKVNETRPDLYDSYVQDMVNRKKTR